MILKTFSIKNAFRFAFYALFSNLSIFVPLMLLNLFVILGLPELLQLLSNKVDLVKVNDSGNAVVSWFSAFGTITGSLYIDIFIWVIVSILTYLFLTHYGAKLIRFSLDIIDKKHVTFNDFFKIDYSFSNYLCTFIVYMLIAMAGFIALIIPGIIVTLQYMFSLFFVIDKKFATNKSLSESYYLTLGHKMQLLKFICITVVLVTAVFMIIGIPVVIFLQAFIKPEIMTMLGKVFSVVITPFIMLAQVHVYRTLLAIKAEDNYISESQNTLIKE